MESFRDQDMRAEQRLGEFMDTYFYSRLKAKDGKTLNFTRMSDREKQLDGIDVCIELEDRRMLIDEKASIYYSNVMIPTFAFEVDSIQEGHLEPVPGWLINDRLRTEYYMLIWPNIKCMQQGNRWVRKDIKKLERDDFTIIEAMLIKKMDIRNALERKGFDIKRILEYANRMRHLYSDEVVRKEEKLTDDIKISFSCQLAEKPINLVIQKKFLKGLAQGIYLISSDGYAIVRG